MDQNNYNFPVEIQPIFLAGEKEITNRKAVVRTDTMQTLGVVSNDYELVKHGSVIDSFREAGKKYHVKEKIQLTNDGAYLFYQMIFPKVEYEVAKGDIVRMMMIAKNSYNGMNSVQIIFGAFRLVCLNGMVIGTKFMQFSFRHVGNVGGLNSNEMIEQYQDAYKNHIRLFGERMPVISEMSRKQLLPGDHLFTDKVVNLPEYLLQEAKTSYEAEKDKTVWGYYNSLTFAITHKMRKDNPKMSIRYGVEAWKSAELILRT